MDDRYRLVYGETHEQVNIKDDFEDKRIGMYPVELLNEYEMKQQLLLNKLNELGYDLIYHEPENNEFDGEWIVVPMEDLE